MKIFYDADGNVIGSIEGATPEIEAALGMPEAAVEVQLEDDLAKRVADPLDPLKPADISVDNGEVVITEPLPDDMLK